MRKFFKKKLSRIKRSKKRRSGTTGIKRRPISDWISGKCFSLVHRTNLVYNTCWEDPRLDRIALELTEDDTILTITSAGCNTLDYALESPKQIYAVDMNPRQNALLELKIAGIRVLEFEDFFALFGKGRLTDFEKIYRNRLRSLLTPWARKYWDRKTSFFDGKRSFYYRGSSGSVARFFNYYVDKVAKIRDEVDALLDAETIEEQQEIYNRSVRNVLWTRFMRKFVGSGTTLSLLGVPRQQRQQVELHYGQGIAEFVEWCIETVFTQLPLHDNYFWRVYLRGEYSPTCCPRYLMREKFEALKAGLVDRISIHTNTIEGFLRLNEVRVSRFVLLDHMDWLSTYRYEALGKEWQAIVNRARPDTRIIFRSGGLRVDYVDPILVSVHGKKRQMGELLTYHQELAAQLHEKDRVHTYGSFYIADLATV